MTTAEKHLLTCAAGFTIPHAALNRAPGSVCPPGNLRGHAEESGSPLQDGICPQGGSRTHRHRRWYERCLAAPS